MPETITPGVLTVGLFDQLFSHNPSATANQVPPPTLRYVKPGEPCDVVLVTAGNPYIEEIARSERPTVLWNLECPGMIPWPSDDVLSRFDLLLSADTAFVAAHANARWLSLVGTWLTDFTPWPKTRDVSFISSDKRLAYTTGAPLAGYTLRHEIAASGLIPPEDTYGAIVGRPIPRKDEALKPYRFSVVVENERVDGWITEKLFDAWACQTVPVYWKPGKGTLTALDDLGFDVRGMVTFEDVADLVGEFEKLDEYQYRLMRRPIEHNYQRIQALRCPEVLLEPLLRERFDLR